MKILAIDTTSALGSVALLEDDQILVEKSWQEASSHTALLPTQLQNLMNDAKVRLEDIDLFAVAKGPGSFTGIRIGLAFVKGLCLQSKKPAIGISTLEAMATQAPDGWMSPMIDARRDQIFAALYHKKGEVLEVLIEEQAEFPEKFIQKMKDLPQIDFQKVTYLGSGAQKYSELLKKEIGSEVSILVQENPLASSIGKLAFHKAQQALTVSSSLDLSPSYLRGSAAEFN